MADKIQLIVELDQLRRNKATGALGDPSKFVPAKYSYYDESTKKFFDMIGKDHLTIEDINSIRTIEIVYKLVGTETIISGDVEMRDTHIMWRVKGKNCYFGKTRNEKGYLDNAREATATTKEGIFQKLFVNFWTKKEKIVHELPSKEERLEAIEKFKAAANKRD